MNEDEKVALEWAREEVAFGDEVARRYHEAGLELRPEQHHVRSARALLDAVRLIRAMEHVAGECPRCGGFYCSDVGCEDYGVTEHKAECEVGSWVRAAQKAGI